MHKVWQELLKTKILKKYHQRIHEGKKPLKSQELFHITIHERNDTGKKQFKCIKCGKASPIIHQMILKGKWQTPFKYTKCTPESVNVNIIILGAALSRNDVTFPGERVVSKNLGKVIRWG